MDEAERREEYEKAILRLDQYIRKTPDGTLELTISGEHIDIDPIVFADLKRSLEETNRKIKSGELNVDEIVKPNFY